MRGHKASVHKNTAVKQKILLTMQNVIRQVRTLCVLLHLNLFYHIFYECQEKFYSQTDFLLFKNLIANNVPNISTMPVVRTSSQLGINPASR